MRDIALIFFLAILVLSCAEIETKAAQPDLDKFFEVYAEFLELSQSDSLNQADKNVLMDSAFVLHGMDSTAFDSALAYFEKRPDLFLDAFEKFDANMRSGQAVQE